jgi:hypothetical protein
VTLVSCRGQRRDALGKGTWAIVAATAQAFTFGGAHPAWAEETKKPWAEIGQWAIERGPMSCRMHAKVGEAARTRIRLSFEPKTKITPYDSVRMSIYDPTWPGDLVEATSGKIFQASVKLDEGETEKATAMTARDLSAIIVVTDAMAFFDRMADAKTLHYQLGTSTLAGQFPVGLSKHAIAKYKECAAEVTASSGRL